MVSEDGKIHRSDMGIPLPAFDAIKKAEGNDLLITPAQADGPLHQGEDQAKDSVAIWEEPSARMGSFSSRTLLASLGGLMACGAGRLSAQPAARG